MSIYATLWEVKVRKNYTFDDEWIKICAQAVPAHIGHPSHYPEGDPYSDFLPPAVEYDPRSEAEQVLRAVVIVAEGRNEKIGQRYVDPILIMTGKEYDSLRFEQLMHKIEAALPWDRDVRGYKCSADGTKTLIRTADLPEKRRQAIEKRLQNEKLVGSES